MSRAQYEDSEQSAPLQASLYYPTPHRPKGRVPLSTIGHLCGWTGVIFFFLGTGGGSVLLPRLHLLLQSWLAILAICGVVLIIVSFVLAAIGDIGLKVIVWSPLCLNCRCMLHVQDKLVCSKCGKGKQRLVDFNHYTGQIRKRRFSSAEKFPFPPKIVERLAEINTWLDQEASDLTALGLPVPKMIEGAKLLYGIVGPSEYWPDAPRHEVKIISFSPPKFDLPWSYCVPVCSVAFPYLCYPEKGDYPKHSPLPRPYTGTRDEISWSQYWYNKNVTTYCIVEEARKEFKEGKILPQGLYIPDDTDNELKYSPQVATVVSDREKKEDKKDLYEPEIEYQPARATPIARHSAWDLITRYPGVWVNRDPYALYRELNFANYPKESALNLYLAKSPLQAVAGFTPQDLQHFFFQLNFLASVEQPIIGKHVVEIDSSIEGVLLKLRLPDQFGLKPPLVGFKLLPIKPTPAALSEEFWNGLHNTIKQPIEFALTSTPERQYFQLICSEADRRMVQTKLSTHLKKTVEIQQVEAKELSLPLPHALAAKPALVLESIKTLSGLTTDPYAHLFELFHHRPLNRQSVCYAVRCLPLSIHTNNILIDFIEEHKQSGITDAGQKCQSVQRALEHKTPAWAAYAHFYMSDSEQEAVTAFATFLRQYDQGRQILACTQEATWSLLANDELTALAHLPTEME